MRNIAGGREQKRARVIVNEREVTQLLALAEGDRFAGDQAPESERNDAIRVVTRTVRSKRPQHDHLPILLAPECTQERHRSMLGRRVGVARIAGILLVDGRVSRRVLGTGARHDHAADR